VAGWCLQYVYASVAGQLHGSPQFFDQYFAVFSSDPWQPILWLCVFFGITHFVIIHGVRNGIERASKILMPLLFVLLLFIVVASCMLPGASAGIDFLFKPDFSKMTSDVFLGALGQSFYSLSIAMGCICTYASYFSRQTNLSNSAMQIGLIDSMVAILAGLMIFPAAASVGVRPDSGPSLIFITLPNVFEQAFVSMPIVGFFISLMFYALLALAALTSLISLHEVSTAFFQEELKTTRNRAAWIVTVTCWVVGVFCSMSLGQWSFLSIDGKSLFSLFDFVTGQIFLPIGGFLTCLFIGWFVPKQLVKDEYTNWGTLRGRLFWVYLFLVRFVCPVAIAAIFLHQFGVV
jgi:NSS family neurotransmitter:Na+ symporter